MKLISNIFALAFCLAPLGAWADAPLSGTAGNNLTAFNGSTGAMNNNTWNQLMNPRSGTTPTADFGNCNSLILRCAQPKCAGGGCTSMDIAYPIVSGCVMSNANCKTHGEPLIQAISAQMVANSTAKANQAASDAQAAASQAAAAQSAQQMQQMQSQLQQMQSQVAQQNAQTTAAVQAALDEQKQFASQQAAEAAAREAAVKAAAPSKNIVSAANNGVSADVLAREKASGQIMTQLENAEVALKDLKKTMQNVFDYAGCDASGNNCAGPKRARAFKQKAGQFFEPYETVLDEVYDALIMAQSLGVDITDIYMMLNGTCNVWGKYLCSDGQTMHYTEKTCQDGKSTRSGGKCTVGQVIPMGDGGCQLIQMLTSNDEVQQNWLYPEQNIDSKGTILSEVRIGCASEALDNSTLFRSRKKQASIDIETLQRMIEQDAPTVLGRGKTANPSAIRFCSVDDETFYELQKHAGLKTLPAKVCVSDKALDDPKTMLVADTSSNASSSGSISVLDCTQSLWKNSDECKCRTSGGTWTYTGICSCPMGYSFDLGTMACNFTPGKATDSTTRITQQLVQSGYLKTPTLKYDTTNADMGMCHSFGGNWDVLTKKCSCGGAKNSNNCFEYFFKPVTTPKFIY